MKQVAFLGCLSSGHGGFPSRPNITASDNVFVNGKPVHRVGDHWPTHCDGNSCHDSITIQGSSSVFVNGVPLARVTDALNCGDTILTGSEDVFCGD